MLIQNALLGLFDGFSVLFEHLLNRFGPVAKLLGFDKQVVPSLQLVQVVAANKEFESVRLK